MLSGVLCLPSANVQRLSAAKDDEEIQNEDHYVPRRKRTEKTPQTDLTHIYIF